jgi:hypothetical protein
MASRSIRPGRQGHQRPSGRLVLEALEDRTVPSGFDFTNPVAVLSAPSGPGSVTAAGLVDDPGSPAGRGLAASSTPSRPLKGHGSGSFTDANGGFFAQGTATHLGNFTHYGALVRTPTDNPAVFLISGRTTYEAANGDKLYAVLSGTLNVQTGVATGTDTWHGGTGRFAGARGSVSLTAQLLPDGSFTFTLDGSIRF